MPYQGPLTPPAALRTRRDSFPSAGSPLICFTDSIGTRIVKRCWLRVRRETEEDEPGDGWKELVIVPGFNELCGGLALNEIKKDELEGLLKPVDVDLGSGEVFLLDGTHLGHLEDLGVDPSR